MVTDPTCRSPPASPCSRSRRGTTGILLDRAIEVLGHPPTLMVPLQPPHLAIAGEVHVARQDRHADSTPLGKALCG